MEKRIIGMRIVDEINSLYEIELGAYQLSAEENIKLRNKLDEEYGDSIVYQYIDADSINLMIKNVYYDDLKDLEEDDWKI